MGIWFSLDEKKDLSLEQKTARTALIYFSYNYYLKHKLQCKVLPGPERNILIGIKTFTYADLVTKVTGGINEDEPSHLSIYKWVTEDSLLKKKTLDSAYQLFKNYNPAGKSDVLSPEDFAKTRKEVIKYLKMYAGSYLYSKRDGGTRRRFTIYDIWAYQGKADFDVLRLTTSSNEERSDALHNILFIVGLFTTGPNSQAIAQILEQMQSEMNQITLVDPSQAQHLQPISKQIIDYRANYKISLTSKVLSFISKNKAAVLIVSLGVALLAYFLITTENQKRPEPVDFPMTSTLNNDSSFRQYISENIAVTNGNDTIYDWLLIALDETDNNLKLKYANRAIEAEPDNGLTYLVRANAYTNLKQYDNALTDMNTSIKFNDGGSLFLHYRYRGEIKEHLDNLKEALSDLDTAIAILSSLPDTPKNNEKYELVLAYFARTRMNFHSGNYSKALSDINILMAIENEPRFDRYAFQGIIHAFSGNLEDAITSYQTALFYDTTESQRFDGYSKVMEYYSLIGDKEFNKVNRNKWLVIPHYEGAIIYADSILMLSDFPKEEAKTKKSLLLERIAELQKSL